MPSAYQSTPVFLWLFEDHLSFNSWFAMADVVFCLLAVLVLS